MSSILLRFAFMLPLAISLVLSLQLHAAELPTQPSYCDPARFESYEVSENTAGLKRAHVYRFGGFNLVGLAVGNSPAQAVQAFAERFSHFAPHEKFCTWYFNDGNDDAAQRFTQRNLKNPVYTSADKLVEEYTRLLDGSFDREAVNFISCARDHGYLAMGCDGMKHRGPSVFSMLLSFSGCSPESTVALVEKVWGKNMVDSRKRLALARKAFELGSARPESRRALQAVFQP